MNRSPFAAAAAVLATSPAPAAAQLSSDLSVKLGLGGEWRTSMGYEGTIRVVRYNYAYTGFPRRRGDESVE